MNKYLLAAASAAILLAGCTPQVARRPFTETEQQWYDYVKANYPAWNPEPTLPQAYQPTLPANTAPVLTAPSISAEPLPVAPEAPMSDLVFEEEVAVVGVAVEPAPENVIPVEKAEPAAVETTEAKPADGAEVKPAAEAPAAAAAEVKAPAAAEAQPAAAAKTALPTEYVVQKGDMLGGIAQKFYGRASLWTVIANANQAALKGSSTVRPGMKLIIPAL